MTVQSFLHQICSSIRLRYDAVKLPKQVAILQSFFLLLFTGVLQQNKKIAKRLLTQFLQKETCPKILYFATEVALISLALRI